MGCETNLRNSNKKFGGESEVNGKLLLAQIRHCTSTRRMFSKLLKGREIQPKGDVPWCNQVISVLIVLISMSYIVLSKFTAFYVKCVKLCWFF